MAKMLDFSRAKKPTLPVKFPDETVVHVYAPTKAMLEEFVELNVTLEKAANDDRESVAVLYDFVARCLSHNKLGRVITAEYIGEQLDVGDLIIFARSYADFIAELKNGKN
jgi:hypothetical protein